MRRHWIAGIPDDPEQEAANDVRVVQAESDNLVDGGHVGSKSST